MSLSPFSRYRSPEELRSFNTMKVSVFILLIVGAILTSDWVKPNWGEDTTSAARSKRNFKVLSASAVQNGEGMPFFGGNIVGYGVPSKGVRLETPDGEIIASSVTNNEGIWQMSTTDLQNWLIRMPLQLRSEGEATEFDLQSAFIKDIKSKNPPQLTTYYDVEEDPMQSKTFLVSFRGFTLAPDGTYIRLLRDNSPIAAVQSVNHSWTLKIPIEQVENSTISVGASIQPSDEEWIVEPIPVLSPPSNEASQKYDLILVSPANEDVITVGPTTYEGMAAPGTLLYVYVDQYLVGKAIAGSTGKWVGRSVLKSAGAGRSIRAVTVPATGQSRMETEAHSVTVLPKE